MKWTIKSTIFVDYDKSVAQRSAVNEQRVFFLLDQELHVYMYDYSITYKK